MAVQSPSVGRVVHYVAFGTPGGEYPAGACRAAIVTEVYAADANNRVGLCILNPTGLFFNVNVPQDEGMHTPGTWHWAEYVPPRE